MFDQNDQNQQAATVVPASQPMTAPMPADMTATPDPTVAPTAPAADPSAFNMTPLSVDPVATTDTTTVSTDTPTADPVVMPDPIAASPDPVTITPPSEPTTEATAGEDPLLGIKKDALQSLSPLLSHLDQTPEEKFRTTMMLIQASDDQSLVQSAYAAAKEITDEKVRAQALLDIINEINYFTQQQPAS